MTSAPTGPLAPIWNSFLAAGGQWYGGEAVTQLQHALQCATLAERAGAEPSLIAACLLHDVGHLLHDFGSNAVERGIDDAHEIRSVRALTGILPDSVLNPIRLHVQAKRWLCWNEQGYWPSLSVASQRSLELQGGIFDDDQAEGFMSELGAVDAVRLRRWDDQAKDPAAATPDLEHFQAIVATLVLPRSKTFTP